MRDVSPANVCGVGVAAMQDGTRSFYGSDKLQCHVICVVNTADMGGVTGPRAVDRRTAGQSRVLTRKLVHPI